MIAKCKIWFSCVGANWIHWHTEIYTQKTPCLRKRNDKFFCHIFICLVLLNLAAVYGLRCVDHRNKLLEQKINRQYLGAVIHIDVRKWVHLSCGYGNRWCHFQIKHKFSEALYRIHLLLFAREKKPTKPIFGGNHFFRMCGNLKNMFILGSRDANA